MDLLRFSVLLSILILVAPRSFPQEPTGTSSPNSSPPDADQATDPDNKRVHVTRFAIGPGQTVNLPVLVNESLVICLRGDSLSRIPIQGPEEKWACGPGNVVSNRSGVTYMVANGGGAPAKLLVVELNDSYAISQLRIPWSERDPLSQNPSHFRMVLENAHARVFLMHLNPREGTAESQFADRLEIALTGRHESVTDVDGKVHEVQGDAGSVRCDRSVMYSTVNLDDKPLDKLIVELKHPFCYEASENDIEIGDAPQSMKTYLAKVKEAIGKKWMKHMPSGVLAGDDRAMVVLQFKIDADGTLPEDSLRFRIVFANDSLMEKALSAVRDTSPFPPFPPDAQKTFIEMRTFSLPTCPATLPAADRLRENNSS